MALKLCTHKAGVRAQGVEKGEQWGSSGLTVPLAEKDLSVLQPHNTLMVLGHRVHFGVG